MNEDEAISWCTASIHLLKRAVEGNNDFSRTPNAVTARMLPHMLVAASYGREFGLISRRH